LRQRHLASLAFAHPLSKVWKQRVLRTIKLFLVSSPKNVVLQLSARRNSVGGGLRNR
jgi:hypothetical protein